MKRKKPFREIEILPAMLYNMRKKMEASRKAATDKISLEDGGLDQVAGGADGDTHPDMCDSSFSEGEWCWFSDSCSYVISDYSDYLYGRKSHSNDAVLVGPAPRFS